MGLPTEEISRGDCQIKGVVDEEIACDQEHRGVYISGKGWRLSLAPPGSSPLHDQIEYFNVNSIYAPLKDCPSSVRIIFTIDSLLRKVLSANLNMQETAYKDAAGVKRMDNEHKRVADESRQCF
jgi:hypothetical protein